MKIPEKFVMSCDSNVYNVCYDGHSGYDVSWVEEGKRESLYYDQDTVEHFVKNRVWKILEEKQGQTVLEKVKKFTKDLPYSSVIVYKGKYEVLCNMLKTPIYAKSDDELEEILKAITILSNRETR
jgi:hypothetical protein